jgi:hypothetical protein
MILLVLVVNLIAVFYHNMARAKLILFYSFSPPPVLPSQTFFFCWGGGRKREKEILELE